MNNSNGNGGGNSGGQLVSQLMQEINSGTGNGNNSAYTDQDYLPQMQQEYGGSGGPGGPGGPRGRGGSGGQGGPGGPGRRDGSGGPETQLFNPDDMVPPPREDDIEEYNENDYNDDDDDSDDDEYYYKENNLTDALSQFGGEYTSFIMDLLKNSVIIFIGYIIFSHPFTHNYIMQFAAMVPGLQGFLEVPTYYLAVNGLLFVIFYFIVSYFI